MAFTSLSWKHLVDTYFDVEGALDSFVGLLTRKESSEGTSKATDSETTIVTEGPKNRLIALKKRKMSKEDIEEDGASSSKRSSIEEDPTSSSDSEDRGAFQFLQNLTNVIIKPAQLLNKKASPYTGSDIWVPLDNEEVAEFPKDCLDKYKKVHPNVEAPKKFHLVNGEFSVLTGKDNLAKELLMTEKQDRTNSEASLEEKLMKNELNDNEREEYEKKKKIEEDRKKVLHHLAITLFNEQGEKYVMSLYRSQKVADVVGLCERCRENPELFRVFPKDVKIVEYINLIFNELRDNMTWKAVHIAAKIGLVEFFENVKPHKLEKNFNMIAQPEGLSPLMLAIKYDQCQTVAWMLDHGANINFVCSDGSNALHIAATTSQKMIEQLWATKQCATLLNKCTSNGCSPTYLAFSSGCVLNMRLLQSYGGTWTSPDASHEATPLIGAMKRGKLDENGLKKILEVKSDALSEKEATTGNSVIHCCTSKKTLLMLLDKYRKDTDPEARNSMQQTPLHVFVQKNDIGLAMSICAYGVDINAEDCNGMTPLHFAVTKGNVSMARLLLCLGADPNKKNHYKETARHLAARLMDREKKMDLVRALVVCNAKSCEKGFVGCAFGCMNREGLDTCKAQMGGEAKDEECNVEEKLSEVQVSEQAASAAYEFVIDPDTHWVDEAYVEKNEVRSYPHDMALKRVKEKLKEMAEKKTTANLVNVLALDGGGIRGLVTVQMLLSLEKFLDKPIIEYFDWIGATSTGSYIMSTLLVGDSLRRAQHYYLQFKDQLFDSWARPYDTVVLERFMKTLFGEERSMATVKYPKVFCTTVRADTYPVKLELCRNYRLPISEKENDDLGFTDPKDITIWKACRRSSAAPTYFSASEGKYIDGGMISNNPTLDLLSEICFWNTTCQKSGNLDQMVDVGCVLSVGTGVTPICPVDPSLFEMNDIMGMIRGIKNLSLMVIDQATATEGAPITRSRSWCHAIGTPYFRFNAPLFKDIILDTNDDNELTKVMWDSVVYAHTHKNDFEEVAQLLKEIGTTEERQKMFKV